MHDYGKTIGFGPSARPTNPHPDSIMGRLATDQKTVAERKWRAGLKPAKPQKPMDVGLWSDDRLQLDLCEMFQEPTNGD